eukprot:Gb_06692 [translate_table: standard]
MKENGFHNLNDGSSSGKASFSIMEVESSWQSESSFRWVDPLGGQFLVNQVSLMNGWIEGGGSAWGKLVCLVDSSMVAVKGFIGVSNEGIGWRMDVMGWMR